MLNIIKENYTVIFYVFFATIMGAVSIYFLGANNPVEEACEKIIEAETGVDIHLTFFSPLVSRGRTDVANLEKIFLVF